MRISEEQIFEIIVGTQLDLPLLTAEHQKQPHDTRVVFYLAQTLDLVDDIPAALDMYQKRIDMGGWQQEVFEAHMRRVQKALTPSFLPSALFHCVAQRHMGMPECCTLSCSHR